MELGYWEEAEDGEPRCRSRANIATTTGWSISTSATSSRCSGTESSRPGISCRRWLRLALAGRGGRLRAAARPPGAGRRAAAVRGGGVADPARRGDKLRRLHDFWHDGRRYRFTPTQAKVLRFLHEAALRGSPWQSGKAVLAAVGSQSLKLGDLFKRRPEWRDMVEGGRLRALSPRACAARIDARPERPPVRPPRFSVRARRTAGFLIRGVAER